MKMKRSYPGSRNTTIIAVSLSACTAVLLPPLSRCPAVSPGDKCFGGSSSNLQEAYNGHKAHAKGPNEIQVRAG